MRYRAVLFDFDYTIGDATPAIVAGYQYALSVLGHVPATTEAIRRTVGYPVPEGYTMLTGDTDESRRQACLALFREKANPMQISGCLLMPGAEHLLKALRENGIAAGIISTKPSGTLQAILRNRGIRSMLALVIGGDDVTRPKPDPEGIFTALDMLSIRSEDALYCGDTVLDAEAAQNAGTDFCAVTTGATERAAFRGWNSVCMAGSLSDVENWLFPRTAAE